MAPSVKSLLERLPQAKDLDRHQCRRALALLEARQIAAGECLFEQGEEPDRLALVLSGSLLVSVTLPNGERIPLGRVQAGGVVGEMGLIDRLPRSATVTCKRAGWLLSLDKGGYDRMVERADPLLPWLLGLAASGLAKRIGEMSERIAAAAIDPAQLRTLPAEPSVRTRRWWAWLDARRRP